MNNKILHTLFIFLTFLFSSCADEKTIKADYSFEVALNVEQKISAFDQVEFESFDDLNLGFFRGNVWLKLSIHNKKDQSMSYMFLSNDRFNRNYRFYKLDTLNNTLKLVGTVIDTLIEDYRTYDNPNPNLKIDLEPFERATYLITSNSDGRTKDASPKIISTNSYYNFISENNIWSIIFYSTIIFLLLINAYLWNIYRQNLYLYYIFYLVSTLFVYLGIEGYLLLLNIPQLHIDHLLFVFVKLWALSLIMYTSKFLEIEIVAPNYYKFIKILLVTVLGGTLLYQFIFYRSSIQYLHYYENLLTGIWILIIIGILLLSIKDRWLELKYYLIPFVLFIAFTIFGVVNVHLQILSWNSFTFVKVGALFEFIGFTYFMTALTKRKLRQSVALENTLKEKEALLAKKIESTDLISIFNLIENSLSSEAEWDDFKSKLNNLNPSFLNELLEKHSNLSKSEIRLLTLIRIGYTQKEIATILNIAPDSVKKARGRVRKKLNLSDSTHLYDYLLAF